MRSDQCRDCPAELVGLCARLSNKCQQCLSALVQRDSLAPGAVIGEAGTPGQAIITMTEGVVALTKRSADGQTSIVGFRYPGEVVMPYRQAFTWPVTVRALVPCQICQLRFAQLSRLSRHDVEFMGALLDVAVQQIEDGFQHVVALGHKDVDRRVASFVLDFAARSHAASLRGHVPSGAIDIPVTRGQIANYLGLRTETVSRAFGRLKARKLIALPKPRQIVILDQRALAALAEDGAGPSGDL